MKTTFTLGGAMNAIIRHPARFALAMPAAVILVIFLVLSALTTTVFAQDVNGEEHVYRIGVVPQFEQRKLFRIWIPILQELEARTGLRFEVVGSELIPDFEKLFLAGEFDFAYMNPYHVVSANNVQGYLPLVCDGSRTLQGILVVRKDSPITSIEELKGQTVAFPSANALGASLLPRSELIPHPVVAHPRVPENHIRRVKEALLAMGEHEKGRALLAKIPMHTVTEAALSNYEPIIKLGLEEFRGPM